MLTTPYSKRGTPAERFPADRVRGIPPPLAENREELLPPGGFRCPEGPAGSDARSHAGASFGKLLGQTLRPEDGDQRLGWCRLPAGTRNFETETAFNKRKWYLPVCLLSGI